MSKEPKRCTACEGKGLYVWTDRSGTVRGGTCEECKGTGKAQPTTETHD